MSVRVRFAPSPTGLLHVGALRDALFKFLLARRLGGQNILRIEDTDRTRYNPDSEQEFIETLRWVGIDFDEGPHMGGPHAPYRQSERKEAGIYAEQIQLLLQKGHAYKAFETSEELDEMRQYQQINKQQVGYFGGSWRDASPDKVAEAEASGKPFVIRQRIPRDETIVIQDLIRGRIEWDSNTVDDPVLLKADGMPTYHFAAMVDDHLMGITHIMRGEEWISSAPKHAVLFDQFGWERPVFVHCPVIVGTDGKKLSKRHGATRVLDYRAMGYLPDALLNFVGLIGWSPGDEREVLTRAELIEAFDLSGLQPSPGKFDMDKLNWMNGSHIRAMALSDLVQAVSDYVSDPVAIAYWSEPPEEGEPPKRDVLPSLARLKGALEADPEYAKKAIELEQERVQTLADFGPATDFFFLDEPPMEEKGVAKWFGQEHVPELFDFLIAELGAPRSSFGNDSPTDGASVEWCESLIREFADKKSLEKLGPVVHPVRVALTGKTVGPGLFELMSALGPKKMIARLLRAKTFLQ
jgi:glutamyl-tRNA synthetase